MAESTSMHTLRAAAALRKKWQGGNEFSLLGWLAVRDTAIAEMETSWGYDGLIIDTEHSTFTVDDLQVVLMAFRGTDCVPIVRVSGNSMSEIKHALDLGAAGILIPMIESAADAAAGCQLLPLPAAGRARLLAAPRQRILQRHHALPGRSERLNCRP